MAIEVAEDKLDNNIKDNALTKFGVTKPYAVFVMIVVVLLLGIFAFTSLRVELYPNMNLPFVVVSFEAPVGSSWVSDLNTLNESTNTLIVDALEAFEEEAGFAPTPLGFTTMVSGIYETVISMMISDIQNIQRSSNSRGEASLFIEFSSHVDARLAQGEVIAAINRAHADINRVIGNVSMPLLPAIEFTLPVVLRIGPHMMPIFIFSTTYTNATFLRDMESAFNNDTNGVADVSISRGSSTGFNLLNGQDAVTVRIRQNADAAATHTVANIFATLESLQQDFPGFENPVVTLDQGTFIDESIGSILNNLIIGGVLAILIIFLFLRSWKMTFAVAISIPLSIIGTFVIMHFMGIGLNLVSMSGLALAVGLLVDNSIIVLENIFRLRKKGMSVRDSVLKGASQIFKAVCIATLTTVCVFFPMFFVQGIIMEIFMDMVMVIVFSLLASLIVALVFLPSIVQAMRLGESSIAIGEPVQGNAFQRFFRSIGRFFARIDAAISKFLAKPKKVMTTGYNKVLSTSIRFKYLSVLLAIGLFVGSIFLVFINGFVIMPPMDTGEFSAQVSINRSYFYDAGNNTQERNVAMANAIRTHAVAIDGVLRQDSVLGTDALISMGFGGGGDNPTPNFNIDIALPEGSTLSTNEAMDRTHSAIMAYLHANTMYPTTHQIRPDTMVTRLVVGSSMMGLGADSISVTLSGPDMDSVAVALEKVFERLFANAYIAPAIRHISDNVTAGTILHINRQITGSLDLVIFDTFRLSDVQTLVTREVNYLLNSTDPLLAPYFDGIRLVNDGFAAQLNDTYSQMGIALAIGFLLIYLVMVALFQSFKLPFIVIITVPLAFTGGFALLSITGLPMSVAAIIGFVILMGVIINNGIIMIDYINMARKDGLSVKEAVVAGANVRARPIFMTAFSTIFALVPMAFGFGASGAMMAPLAIVAIGGFIYGTFMSLVIVPAFYCIFTRDKKIKPAAEVLPESQEQDLIENPETTPNIIA